MGEPEEDNDEVDLRIEKDPLIGTRLANRYQVVSVLGRGGMGVVYRARDLTIDRFVAIKTLHVGRAGEAEALKRFHSEAQAISRVRHPHTSTLFDFGVSSEGLPYLVMQIMEGTSFRKVLRTQGPLPLARVEHIFRQIIEALAHAHSQGVVHRDLKPENIILGKVKSEPDFVYVLDFGIASMVGGGRQEAGVPAEIIGSPPYMSPEQCALIPNIDHRSDIYSLGICLFEALSGAMPFKARTAMELLDCHISGRPRLLRDVGPHTGTYESITQVISKALAKDPDGRQQSIEEFGEELEQAIDKDSRRGLHLKDRIDLEAPRTEEYVEIKQEVIDELAEEDEVMALAAGDRRQYFAARNRGIFSWIHSMIFGDEDYRGPASASDKVSFDHCPHCGAENQSELALCLSCGRSLAARDDFSRIRAARGDFILPKRHDSGAGHSSVGRIHVNRSRAGLGPQGRLWSRHSGLLTVAFLLILCVFVMCGGVSLIKSMIERPVGNPPILEDDGR